MDTIGFLELSSIAAGISAADAMLKVGNVELIFARASCPGKYYILIHGKVGGVTASLSEANAVSKGFIVDELIIPKVHEKVISAINMSAKYEAVKSIGVMEFFSVASSIVAADVAVKAANVDLIDLRLGTGIGGKSFAVITGELTSVESAIRAGTEESIKSGMLLNKVVISKPRKEVIESLF